MTEIRTSNEVYGTKLIVNQLKDLLSADPPMSMHTDFAHMWDEHIQSERDRLLRDWAPSATTYCSSQQCDKLTAFKAQHHPQDEPFNARTQRTFLIGHMIEAQLKAQLRAAGITFDHHCAVQLPAPWVTKYGPVYVSPDGVNLSVDSTPIVGYKDDNVILEIKSAATKSFSTMCKLGIQAGSAGYYDQQQLAMLGHDADVSAMLIWNKDTAHLAEFWITRDETRIAQLTNLMMTCEETPATSMEPGYALQPHLVYHKGKPKAADQQRVYSVRENTRGAVYGWDEKVGEKLRHWECSYCNYKNSCRPDYNIEMEMDGKYPVWIVTEKE